MREIVHIQAGQCGNQIGAKVGDYLNFTVLRYSWFLWEYYLCKINGMTPVSFQIIFLLILN